MINAKTLALFCAGIFLSASYAQAQIEYSPVINLDLLGGQFFFEGEQTAFSGNGDWLLAPAVKFNDRWSAIPIVSGKYRRSREVQELIGGGFLTQETLENNASVAAIYNLNETWKLKWRGHYRSQLLVESADEKLGKGIFDNHKYGSGLEAERKGQRVTSLRASLGVYQVEFPHYTSLASGSDLGSEIQSGAHTLDFRAYDFSTSADVLLTEKIMGYGSLLASYRPYADQKIVTVAGTYTTDLRLDQYGQSTLGAVYKLPEMDFLEQLFYLEGSAMILKSNQHNYDAARTKFNPDFYNYFEWHVSPRWSAKILGRISATLQYDFSVRNYQSRPAQLSDGSYSADAISLNTHSFNAELRYYWRYGFSIVGQTAYRSATSNMRYEKTYRYNYHALHYFLGLAWEFE